MNNENENTNLALNIINSASRFPGRRAVVFYDRVLTYSQLAENVSRLAAAFTARGICAGARFAIALPNVTELVTAYYAALAAGAIVVPVNPLYTHPEIDHILRDSGASAVITHPMFEQTIRQAIGAKTIDMFYSDSLGDPAKECIADILKTAPPEISPVHKSPTDTAIIAYTNAVSGWPLGAQLTHGGLNHNVDACVTVAEVAEDDVFLTVLPLYHAFSATTCMHLPLKTGAATILNETFSEKRVVGILESEPVSIFPTVPAIFQKLYDVYGGSGKDFSSVKAFVPGGAPMPVELHKKFELAFNAKAYEGYGITECGPVSAANPIYKKIRKIGTIGPATPGTTVVIADENGNELPTGSEGEIRIKGPNVMSGYHNQPEATAKFLRDGWMLTGDRARMDEEGFITITGLIKRMALVGGFNAYPAEIERIVSSHPAVETCEAFPIDDHAMGQRVAARVTLKPGAAATPNEIRKFARQSLAPYKTPKYVDII